MFLNVPQVQEAITQFAPGWSAPNEAWYVAALLKVYFLLFRVLAPGTCFSILFSKKILLLVHLNFFSCACCFEFAPNSFFFLCSDFGRCAAHLNMLCNYAIRNFEKYGTRVDPVTNQVCVRIFVAAMFDFY